LWRLAEIRRSVWIDSLSRDDTGNGTLSGMIESGGGGAHSNPTIFQRALSGSSPYYKQPRELAESEDYSKPSRHSWTAELRSESPIEEGLGDAWTLIGTLRQAGVDHGEVLERVRTFADSLDELVEVMQGKSRRAVRQG